jgi:hypothetical protein
MDTWIGPAMTQLTKSASSSRALHAHCGTDVTDLECCMVPRRMPGWPALAGKRVWSWSGEESSSSSPSLKRSLVYTASAMVELPRLLVLHVNF